MLPRPPSACDQHRPDVYAHHLNLYFISLVEVVSSESFYAVFTARRLFAPQTAVLHRPREVPEHRQWPCRQSKTKPTQVPSTACFCEVLVSSCSHDVPLYFAFILWYYTLFIDLLFYK